MSARPSNPGRVLTSAQSPSHCSQRKGPPASAGGEVGGEVGVKAQWTHFGQFMGRASKVRGLARMLPQKPSKQGARLFERLTTTCIRRAWVAPLPLRGPSLLSCQRLALGRPFCHNAMKKGSREGLCQFCS